MTFYSGKLWTGWRGDLFSGALKYQLVSRLKRTGNRLVREERLLQGLHERIRDVREGPGGARHVALRRRQANSVLDQWRL